MLRKKIILWVFVLACGLMPYATCKYSFKDVAPIPAEVKTFRVQPLENHAQYINPQLSPLLTEAVKEKVINTTRLHQTNADDAHYDISGYVSQYATSTVSILNGNSGSNRLTVGFHLIFKNTLDVSKNFEADIIQYEDFDAKISLTEAEATLTPRLVKDITDNIFNRIFSNW